MSLSHTRSHVSLSYRARLLKEDKDYLVSSALTAYLCDLSICRRRVNAPFFLDFFCAYVTFFLVSEIGTKNEWHTSETTVVRDLDCFRWSFQLALRIAFRLPSYSGSNLCNVSVSTAKCESCLSCMCHVSLLYLIPMRSATTV